MFLTVITHVDIMPKATIEYSETWDQLNNDGMAVPPGVYKIYAGIVLVDAPRVDPVTIAIR